MNIVIFDTETTSLIKPFCYDIGYVIIDSDNWQILEKKSFVVEQVWHNLPLFSTAYYAEKRPIYIKQMRSKKIQMKKIGFIMREIEKDFEAFKVKMAFAYNSPFDEKVFKFNCDWYKVINPFDNIPIKDIRGFAHFFIVNDNYKNFCEENNLFTDSKNYSTTAEAIYKYISKNTDFIEAHTALNDSEIESAILYYCIKKGADINKNYLPKRSIERNIEKVLTLQTKEEKIYTFKYSKFWINKDKTKIKLR